MRDSSVGAEVGGQESMRHTPQAALAPYKVYTFKQNGGRQNNNDKFSRSLFVTSPPQEDLIKSATPAPLHHSIPAATSQQPQCITCHRKLRLPHSCLIAFSAHL